jgi:hypothetical protein
LAVGKESVDIRDFQILVRIIDIYQNVLDATYFVKAF